MFSRFGQPATRASVGSGLVLLLAFIAIARTIPAQSIVRIDASQPPSCAGCSLTLTKVATLGNIEADDDPGTATHTSGLAYDSKGRWFVTSVPGDKVIVYDPSGRLLQNIGRKGQGPGEFDRAMKIAIGPGDSIHVLDQTRISTFSPALKFVRTTSVPFPTFGPFGALSDGSFAVGTIPFQRNAHPLRLIRPKGGGFSIGPTFEFTPGSCPICHSAFVGTSKTPSQFLSIQRTTYELSEWRSGGEILRRIAVLNSPWFTPVDSTKAIGGPDIRPQSAIDQLYEDGAGKIWIEGHIPTAEWRPTPRTAPGARRPLNIPIGVGMAPKPERLRMLATVIEVLEPATKRVMLTQKYPGRNLRLISPDFVSEVREDADGAVVLDIFKVGIKRP